MNDKSAQTGLFRALLLLLVLVAAHAVSEPATCGAGELPDNVGTESAIKKDSSAAEHVPADRQGSPCRDRDPACSDTTPVAAGEKIAAVKGDNVVKKEPGKKSPAKPKKKKRKGTSHTTASTVAKHTATTAAATGGGAHGKTYPQCGGVRMTVEQVREEMKGEKNFSGRNMEGLMLRGFSLQGANLAGACLAAACLERANLAETNLKRSILSGADLTMATLRGANLEASRVDATIFDGAIWIDGHICPPGATGDCPDTFDTPGK